MNSNRTDQNTGGALLEFSMRTAVPTAVHGKLTFRLQCLFAIINKISMVYLICGGSSVG